MVHSLRAAHLARLDPVVTYMMSKKPYPFAVVGAAVIATVVVSLFAAAADNDLSKQQPTYKIKQIPPAPVLKPDDELKTFKLPPGFHLELVAAEPLVEEPIALAFDPDGRIYVVELRAYMPDADGKGEMEPIARVSLLEDTGGDGRMDKSTPFLDKLIIPRAVGLVGA